MKNRMKLRGFTLIEMLIVMFIIGILSVVLVESYLTISRTALKIEQEKNLSEEALILTQTFQAISDEATIDYEAYSGEYDLAENNGFTNILYLTGGQWTGTSIYTTGGENCLDLEGNFPMNADDTYPDYSNKIRNALSGCDLVLQQGDQITSLVPSGKVIISNVKFRIIPYDSNENYFKTDSTTLLNDVHQPAFWLFIHLYAPLYQPTGTNKIDQPLQLFFNLNL